MGLFFKILKNWCVFVAKSLEMGGYLFLENYPRKYGYEFWASAGTSLTKPNLSTPFP